MSRKKGMSYEEKRTAMEQFFHEKQDVFQLKHLETKLPKEKGIISQAVKDVLKSLVDDDIVCYDKIGSSNFYWSFPSQALLARKNKMVKLQGQIDSCKRQREEIEEKIAGAGIGREDTDDRKSKLARVAVLDEENIELKGEVAKYADLNPDLLEDYKLDKEDAVTAANRWTDNIFTLRSYLVNTFNCDPSDINRQFDIAEDLDYVS